MNCHYHGVPFYTALPTSTMDMSLADGAGIPIEERKPDELYYLGATQTAPLEAAVYNPAFDVTPHELLTGIITEKGLILPPFEEKLTALFPG